MENSLARLTELIERLQKYSGTSDKKLLLKQYPDLKEILKLTYDPYIKFYITGKQVEDNLYLMNGLRNDEYTYKDYIPVLQKISERVFTGDLALLQCMKIIRNNTQYKDTIIKILNKDLRCGISIKTINSVFPGLIQDFQVPLAKDYNPLKHNVFNNNYFISRKLDGIRCLCFITKEDITFLSRNGKEFWTLDTIKNELLQKFKIPESGIVLDGELCIFENGVEDFNLIVSEYRRKDHTINNPRYYIFDMYSLEGFKKAVDSFPNYKSKFSMLKQLFNGYQYIKVLEQIPLGNENELNYPDYWEGLIIRKNNSSLFKRSNDLLKVKGFKEAEFEVLDIETSTMMIDGKVTNTCGSLLISYKGHPVDVGSGLSRDQRLEWYNDPTRIIGKTITVKYTSESRNKEGKLSLRFPRLKGVRDEY